MKVWERLIVFHKCQGITYIRAAGVARRPTARAQLHPQSRPNYISLTEAIQHGSKQLLIPFSHPPARQQQAGYFVGLSMPLTEL
jgi:hypothetical protein